MVQCMSIISKLANEVTLTKLCSGRLSLSLLLFSLFSHLLRPLLPGCGVGRTLHNRVSGGRKRVGGRMEGESGNCICLKERNKN